MNQRYRCQTCKAGLLMSRNNTIYVECAQHDRVLKNRGIEMVSVESGIAVECYDNEIKKEVK